MIFFLFKYTQAIYKDKRRKKMNVEIYIFNTLKPDSRNSNRRWGFVFCFFFIISVRNFSLFLDWLDTVQTNWADFVALSSCTREIKTNIPFGRANAHTHNSHNV